jgi:membrane protease subunit (stomatin/prohibitin family)
MTITSLAQFFGKSEVAFIDMAANQSDFSQKLKDALSSGFKDYGLELQSFYVQSISLPDDLQTHFDKVASMNMVGDLQRYARFQTADSISTAAANEGGIAGAGAGIGAGVAMGQMMAQAMGNTTAPSTSSTSSDPTDPVSALEKVHDLFKKGILTQAEFEAKKAELLQKIK